MKKLTDESVASFTIKQAMIKGLGALAVIMIAIVLTVGFVYLCVS